MSSKPVYQNDYNACRFLGSGPCLTLGKMSGDPKRFFDFYICGKDNDRTFIARYGNRDSDYMSGVLFECDELTALDKVALYNGLTLTYKENERLLRVLARMFRDKLGVHGTMALSTGVGCMFGTGNVVWENV